MKKLATILTAAVMFLTVNAFAARADDIPAKVKAAMEKSFVNASDVTWQKSDQLYNVSFTWNSYNVKATYNADGTLLSMSREIGFNQLPLKVIMAITKKYSGYKISDKVFEIISDDTTLYHLTIENDKETISLSSTLTGDLDVENRIKK